MTVAAADTAEDKVVADKAADIAAGKAVAEDRVVADKVAAADIAVDRAAAHIVVEVEAEEVRFVEEAEVQVPALVRRRVQIRRNFRPLMRVPYLVQRSTAKSA